MKGENGMTTLYHGSYTTVETPLAKIGRNNLDFGKGFYLTQIRSQAEAWAQVVAGRRGRFQKPFLNVYAFDETKTADFRYKRFERYDLEWLEYVLDCRRGGVMQQAYDIVEGGVANDNVIDTVEDYEKGIITAEQALGQLRYKKVNHQLCILSQEVVDACLTFVESVEIIREE